jgi:uncharacterized RDD family membrane protein YckC
MREGHLLVHKAVALGRAFASIDLLCISFICVFGALIGGLFGPLSPHLSSATFILVFVLYYIVLETFQNGTTVGKWLLRLSRASSTNKTLNLARSSLRAALFVLWPLTLAILLDLVFMILQLPQLLSVGLNLFVLGVIVFAWPVSVLYSGGQSSLFDVMAGTRVLSMGRGDDASSRGGIAAQIVVSILASGLLLVVLSWLVPHVRRSIDTSAMPPRGVDKDTRVVSVLRSRTFPLILAHYYSFLYDDPFIQVTHFGEGIDTLTFKSSILSGIESVS